jgi:hypothetical protein
MYSMAAASQHLISMFESDRLTLGENLPFAGLAAWGVWKNHVQLVEQTLHFTSSLPFCHLVAYTELWSTTVIAATSGECSGVVGGALQARNTTVLHRVVVCGYHV